MNDSTQILARVAEAADTITLDDPAAIRARGAQRTRRQLAVGSALVATIAAVAGLSTVRDDHRTPPPAGGEENTLQGWQLEDSTEVPGSGPVSAGAGSLWVSDVDERPGQSLGTITEVDPDQLDSRGTLTSAGGALPLFTGTTLWQAGAEESDEVWRFDTTEVAMERIRPSTDRHSTQTGIADAAGSVYVANNEPGTLSRLDVDTGEVLFERAVAEPGRLGPLASAGDRLYAGVGKDVVALDESGTTLDRLTLDGPVSAIEATRGRLYVVTHADHLAIVDVSSPDHLRVLQEGQVYPTIDTPLMDLEVAGGYVWAIAIQTERLVQLDPDSLELRGSARIANDRLELLPSHLTAGDGALFVRTVGGLLKFSPE